jgi:signal peptidase I
MEDKTDEELRALAYDSRASKEDREQARELLAKRPPGKKPAKKKSRGAGCIVAGAALTLFGAIALAIVVRVALYEAFEIDGPSSAPAYADGDRVVVGKYAYGLFLPFSDEASTVWGEPAIGEVVILRSPRDNIDVIKRIVGLPGDRIEIRADALYRNGETVTRRELGEAIDGTDAEMCFEESVGDTRWVILESQFNPPEDMAEVTVPADHVFVLGDNRDRSFDSRAFGMVPFTRLKGLVLSHYVTADDRIACP